ncbi:hypothetical protein K6119_17260 [Paracrocinitomix mangrovi]|uniref:hypothetical protein n=1 Tax=Paracrocinitomix mangrovi TaxID=2862509 RepID=UPI001C8D4F54|nr:hypothetical protein [Paracrocinitomix mangrovi]UKN01476.1 hypothetical protein K6119_17260 [Paracrocinitomix mangrovi]
MLDILILIACAVGFYKAAEKRGLTAWLYALMSVLAFFAGAFLAGLFGAMINPQIAYDQVTLVIAAFAGALIAQVILYLIMINAAKNKTSKEERYEDEVMDSSSIDDL